MRRCPYDGGGENHLGGGNAMADAIERVTLTHLQIPLKEPFRISGGEVGIKDAILVTVATPSGIGLGESSPMAVGFGYSRASAEVCWEDRGDRIDVGVLRHM